MAFPDGWLRCAEISVQQSQIPGSGSLSNFPLLLTAACFPSILLDADGGQAFQNGGGDLRFSSDPYGASQLPCEVVSFVTANDPANASAEIWVKLTLSKTADTKLYAWRFPGGGQSQPAVTDTYGRNAVWSDYAGVWHGDDLASATGANNLAANGNAAVNSATAKIGAALSYDGAGDWHNAGSAAAFDNHGALTLQFWSRIASLPAAGVFPSLVNKTNSSGMGVSVFYSGASDDQILGFVDRYGIEKDKNNAVSASTWFQVHAVTNGANTTSGHALYKDGAALSSLDFNGDNGATLNDSAENLELGRGPFGDHNGQLDEVRWRASALDADWIAAEYANQNAPGSFAIGALIGQPRFSAQIV